MTHDDSRALLVAAVQDQVESYKSESHRCIWGRKRKALNTVSPPTARLSVKANAMTKVDLALIVRQ